MSSARNAGLIMMPIISRARARRDKRGQRNFGIATCGMRMPGLAEAMLAYAIATSPARERAAHRLCLAITVLLAAVTKYAWITLRGGMRGKTPGCPALAAAYAHRRTLAKVPRRRKGRQQPPVNADQARIAKITVDSRYN